MALMWDFLNKWRPLRLSTSEHEHSQQLLARLLLITVGLVALLESVEFLVSPATFSAPQLYSGIAIIGISILAYLFNSAGHTRYAAAIINFILLTVPGARAYSSDEPLFLAFCVIPVLISAMFFSSRWTAGIAGGMILTTFLLNMLFITDSGAGFRIAWYFLVFSSGLIITFMGHRARIESIRQHELEQANQRLSESELRFRRAIELAPFPIVLHSEQGTILVISQAITGITGYTLDEVPTIEKWVERAYEPGQRAAVQQGIRQLSQLEGVVHEGEFRIICKSGERRIWEFSSAPIGTLADGQRLIVSIAADVTERRQDEVVLRENTARTRAILDAIPDLMFVLDAEGRHLDFYAPSSSELLVDPADFLGKRVSEVLPESVAIAYQGTISRTLAEGGIQVFEYQLKFALDDIRFYEARMVRKSDTTVLVVVRNITDRKLAENALRQNQRLLQGIIENTTVGITVKEYPPDEPEGHYILANRRSHEWMMAQDDDMIGKRPSDFFPPEFAQSVNEVDRQVMQTGVTRIVEATAPFRSGTRTLLSYVTPLPDAFGAPPSICTVSTDITEQKRVQQAEREQRELAEALQEVAAAVNSSLDLNEVLDMILSQAQRITPHDAANIMMIDPRGVSAIVRHRGYEGRSVPEGMEALRFDTSGLASRQGVDRVWNPHIIPDTHAYPSWEPRDLNGIDLTPLRWVRSHMEIPILFNGNYIGALNLDSASTQAFSAQQLAPLQAFASHAAIALENARLHSAIQGHVKELESRVLQRTEELRQSEEKYRLLVQSVSDVIWVIDRDGRIAFLNDAVKPLLGYDAQALLGQPVLNYIHPDDHDLVQRQMASAIAQGLGWEVMQVRWLHKDGSLRYFESAAQPKFDSRGQITGINGVGRDVTARALAQFAEEEQRVFAEALAEITKALNGTLNLDELLEKILVAVERVVPHDWADIQLINTDAAEIVKWRSSYPEARERLLYTELPLASTPRLRVMIDSKHAIVINDTGRDDRWTGYHANDWLKAYMGSPILLDGEPIGFISLGSTTPNAFENIHAERLLTFADQVAIALLNAQRYQQVQELAALKERQKIARDLHDAVSQTLWASTLISDSLPYLWEKNREQALVRLQQLSQLSRGALAELRTLLLEMRPAALMEVSMGALLEQLARAQTSHTEAQIITTLDGECRLRSETQWALYRISQEALNNAVRHSRATQIELILRCADPERAELVIRDNGQGFDPRHIPEGHLGVRIMHERARAAGIRIEIQSQPGEGTELRASWARIDESQVPDAEQ